MPDAARILAGGDGAVVARPAWALPAAAVVAALAIAIRLVHPDAADAPLLLLVVPVALVAAYHGARWGFGVAVAAAAISVGWNALDQPVTLLGHVSRSVAFLVVGVVVGHLGARARALVATLSRHSELSLDLLATADLNGHFVRVNPAWQRVLGHSQEELVSRPFVEFVHPDDREATLAEAQALADGHDSVSFRNRYRAADGSYRWLEWRATTALDDGLIYAIARDITAQKQAEETVERQNELLERRVRQRTRELEDARRELLARLALVAEFRDDVTHRHTERVGTASALIALQLGLPRSQVELLRQAAPLHDIGKLGIPDAILLKPGRLTPSEYDAMKAHAGIGARVLDGSRSDVLAAAAEISLTHHEWWDGSGYPHGLREGEIPLFGRIVAIADVFDALTHDRPYKSAATIAEALAEIDTLAGRQFDPEIAAAFRRVDHAALTAPAHGAAA